MTHAHRQRLLAFAGGLTLVGGLLTGLVDAWTYLSPLAGSHDYLDPAISGPAARFGARYVEWVGLVGVMALYVLLPFAVAYVSTRGDERRPSFHIAWAVAAVAWLPVLAVAVAVSRPGNPYTPPIRRVVGVVIPVIFAAGLVAVHRFALARSPDDVDRRPPIAVFANFAFLVVFIAGVWLGILAAGPAGALVEQEDGGIPQPTFETETYETDDGTVLVITHDGGDIVPAEYLRIDGEGFDDVSGVVRSEPGPWPASEATDRDGEPVVTAGDSVTVGVTDACVIRVLYVRGGTRGTVGKHACGGP
jgi:hypothetical protein